MIGRVFFHFEVTAKLGGESAAAKLWLWGQWAGALALLGCALVGEPAHGGSLDGKLVFVSAGHGIWDQNLTWSAQRGNTHGLVEDFLHAESVNQYLIPYLENAGAEVLSLRERGMGAEMVIVDNEDLALFPGNGTYAESGAAGAFASSGLPSFANFQAPYSSSANPFAASGNEDRLLTTALSETARATWVPVLPSDGHYTVYVSYTADPDRASDAHYIVKRPGGATHVLVDQTVRGSTWLPLGRFWFEAGADASRGAVVLANDSAVAGDTVSADAVRFGGGMGDVRGATTGVVSGRPRWEEASRHYVQYLGAPQSVWDNLDPGVRSRYAAWANAEGVDDAVYVSVHSNAPSPARGTSSYVYGPNPPDGTYNPTATAGSVELMNSVHDELIQDIRNAWDAGWTDRGKFSAFFAEINPTLNPEMPSAWFELAFHDTAADAEQLAEPRFRQLTSRAIYQGIVKYFADRDTEPVHLLPEPPVAVDVQGTGTGEITVTWGASPTDTDGVLGDAADAYRVYLSPDGKSFDAGRPAAGTSLVVGDLPPGELLLVRVTGVNAGGESLPSETLAVTVPGFGERRVLLVTGFDRLDRLMLVQEDLSVLGLGVVDRMFLERMNTFDYTIEHAQSISAAGVGVDSTSNEAVLVDRIALGGWPSVAWYVGVDSRADETLSAGEQSRLQTYLDGGGRLFLSGAELGWDLDAGGSTSDRAFYEGTLGSDYVADDASTYSASGTAGSIFVGLTSVDFDDGTRGSYNVEYPDVVAALGGASPCLDYDSLAGAGCVELDAGSYRAVTLAFPFETIYPQATREDVMERALDFLIDLSECPGAIELTDLEINDTRAIRAAGALTVDNVAFQAGADVSLESSVSVALRNGVRFEDGATVRISIDPALDCSPP
jgi:hypothetical protein